MLAGCRHITVRLWITALLGGLTCLLLLPGLQPVAGLNWIVVPAAAILIGAYWLMGILMNRLGRLWVERLLQEATVWERAGMGKEAEQAFAAAMGAVDGFLLSPRQHKRYAERLLSCLAHYYLSQTSLVPRADATVMAYLTTHPQDSQAALGWLQSIVDEEAFVRDHHDLAQRLADAQPGNRPLQHLVARYFLSAARTDYAAGQAYRRVLAEPGPEAETLAVALGEIFLGQGRSDEWALEIFLTASRLQPERGQWRQGLAACLDSVRETEQSHSLLQRARQVLAGTDAERLETLRRGFERPFADLNVPPLEEAERRAPRPEATQRAPGAGWAALGAMAKTSVGALAGGLRFLASGRGLQRALKWACIAGLAIGMAALLTSTLSHLKQNLPRPEANPPSAAAPPAVSEPFTLQVAAYFKLEDAQHFVQRLKESGLDAYWTEALSGQKKWYQVRVSHFPDQETAKRYGESLKAKRIIDDFYVANYKKPDGQ